MNDPSPSLPIQTSYLEPIARARISDPETSKRAARSVFRIRQSQTLILRVLRGRGPMTDEEIYATLLSNGFFGERELSPSGARTRRKELVDLGLVIDAGAVKKTRAGRDTTIWKAKHSAIETQEGRR